MDTKSSSRAFPNEYSFGLTKYEYAAIHIAAGHAMHTCNINPSLVCDAVENLFEEIKKRSETWDKSYEAS